MTQRDFFLRVLKTLETLDIPYMITGSVGAMLFSEPRLTNDMDVVVELLAGHVGAIEAAFMPPEYYAPPQDVVRGEIAACRQFNIIHVASGSKVDLILRKNRPYDRQAFLRRQKVPFTEAYDAFSASAEDIILSKLRSYREGESQKHLADIRSLLRVSGETIDRDYLEHWAAEIEVLNLWCGLAGR